MITPRNNHSSLELTLTTTETDCEKAAELFRLGFHPPAGTGAAELMNVEGSHFTCTRHTEHCGRGQRHCVPATHPPQVKVRHPLNRPSAGDLTGREFAFMAKYTLSIVFTHEAEYYLQTEFSNVFSLTVTCMLFVLRNIHIYY